MNPLLRRLSHCLPAALLLGLAWPVHAASTDQARLWREQARAHEHGEGVPRDLNLALDLYCKAALAGDAEAHHSLGWIHANGRGVDRHDGHAAWHLRQAAELGDEPSRRLLATISTGGAANGVSVPPIDTLTNSTPTTAYLKRSGRSWRMN